jgi:hypothetical protein
MISSNEFSRAKYFTLPDGQFAIYVVFVQLQTALKPDNKWRHLFQGNPTGFGW